MQPYHQNGFAHSSDGSRELFIDYCFLHCTMERLDQGGQDANDDDRNQQQNASRAPGCSARRRLLKAAVGSSKNITPKRENNRSKLAGPKS